MPNKYLGYEGLVNRGLIKVYVCDSFAELENVGVDMDLCVPECV